MLTTSLRLNGGYTSVENKLRYVLKVDQPEFRESNPESFQTVKWTNQETNDVVAKPYSVSV